MAVVPKTPSWELVGTFLEVMRQGSLSGAARALGVAHPTARRRIAALEDALDQTLFRRAPNGLVPTQAAWQMLPFAQTMEATARSLVRALSGDADALSGTVRVTASELVGVEVLPPIFARLSALHPALQVELALSNDVADLGRRDADVAIRMAPLAGADLVARRIGAVDFGFFASPSYLERHPPPDSLEDLRGHDLIGRDTSPQILDGLADLGLQLRPRDFKFRTDHDLAYLAAMRAGLGIGITHAPLARSPSLVRVLPRHRILVDMWLVAPGDLRRVRRVRAVLDHLTQELRAHTRGAA